MGEPWTLLPQPEGWSSTCGTVLMNVQDTTTSETMTRPRASISSQIRSGSTAGSTLTRMRMGIQFQRSTQQLPRQYAWQPYSPADLLPSAVAGTVMSSRKLLICLHWGTKLGYPVHCISANNRGINELHKQFDSDLASRIEVIFLRNRRITRVPPAAIRHATRRDSLS
jgi:hypothetical protein